ncbi:MAG: tankyrase-2-like [Rickettsiales bacterium]|jgi:ankyrin repeat protein|nr:tankyrase-2-like [Rickettsiales bacterium]
MKKSSKNFQPNINAHDGEGKACLHHAVLGGDKREVNELLNKGADPNVSDNFGATPLHYAAREGNTELINLFLQTMVNPNAQDNLGATPLHYAAFFGKVKVLQCYLEHGFSAALYVKDQPFLAPEGETPVEVAARLGWGRWVRSCPEKLHKTVRNTKSVHISASTSSEEKKSIPSTHPDNAPKLQTAISAVAKNPENKSGHGRKDALPLNQGELDIARKRWAEGQKQGTIRGRRDTNTEENTPHYRKHSRVQSGETNNNGSFIGR